MSRFFAKIAAFLAINAVIAGFAAMAPVGTMNPGYEDVAVVFDYVESLEHGDRLNVILGDSRAEWRLNAKALGFVNLSFAGATPVEGYYMLDRMLRNGADIDKLVISYGPFHIFSQDTFHAWTRTFQLIDDEYLNKVLEEMRELGDEEYLNYQWTALESIDTRVPWLPESLKFKLVNVLSIDVTLKTLLSQGGGGLVSSQDAAAAAADLPAKFLRADVPGFVNDDEENSPEYRKPSARSPVNELYLNRLIEMAKSHGIQISFLVMPFNRDVLQPEHDFFAEYFAVIREAGLKNCVNDATWWPNDRFLDSHHLNSLGVQEFNRELAHRLEYCH